MRFVWRKMYFMKLFKLPYIFLLLVALGAFKPNKTFKKEVIETLKTQILAEANWAMEQLPRTITSESSGRSTGSKNDFYSEGDYWWPNPNQPDGPYIQRDGLTNPQNFIAHRLAMIRFSQIIGALASAYQLTSDEKYVKLAVKHIDAWFLNSTTLMNPNLQYAQAIKGVATGRGIGIIDTIQLMEVVQGLMAMEKSKSLPKRTMDGTKKWFSSYLNWLTSHKYGIDEMNAKNNHGTCWVMQVACFAKFTKNEELLDFCKKRYKEVLLPQQMEKDGSFPLELKRTKPYAYSIFNLDAFATICQILSTPKDNLWNYQTAEGLGIKKGVNFLYPYLADKKKWPYAKDVMYWEYWPVAQPSLIFAAIAYHQNDFLNTWKKAEHQPKNDEVIRNLPVRHPLIWL